MGAFTPLTPDDGRRTLLVVGSSLGIAVADLWRDTLPALADRVAVVGWDLPGHGAAAGDPGEGASVAGFADEVASWVRAHATDRSVRYAGVSIGGAVGLQLALAHPDVVDAVGVVCSAAYLGAPDAWRERATLVEDRGTEPLVDGSRDRWFDPAFVAREPDRVAGLLDGLRRVEPTGYAACCRALAGYDLRGRLGDVRVPVVVVGGSSDAVAPPDAVRGTAAETAGGSAVVLDGVGHQAPAEDPGALVDALVAGLRL